MTIAPGLKLDRIDLRILDALESAGRMSNADLANAVYLSPSPCLSRTKRLQNAGIITGYGADIDFRRLGGFMTIFAEIALRDANRRNQALFDALVQQSDEIAECYQISGHFDYFLKFATLSVNRYQILMDDLCEGRGLVERYVSYIAVKTPVPRRGPAFLRLFG